MTVLEGLTKRICCTYTTKLWHKIRWRRGSRPKPQHRLSQQPIRRKRPTPYHEYGIGHKLVSYFKIPYLRVSPNPFSIAFLLLVIFSNDVWPHNVTCAPLHFRHFNHMRTLGGYRDHQHNISSKSNQFEYQLPYIYQSPPPPMPLSLRLSPLLSLMPTPAYHSSRSHKLFVNRPRAENMINNYSNNNNVNSGAMFLSPLLSPPPQQQQKQQQQQWRQLRKQFLKRYSRSSYKTHQNAVIVPQPLVKKGQLPSSASGFSYLPGSATVSSSSSSSLLVPCSHIGDETNEISARAFTVDTVFEGKVRSKSTVKDPVGKYGVTFVVQRVYKDQSNGQTALRPKTQVRLFFIEKSPTSNTTKPTAHCAQRYNFTKRSGELPKANIKRGRRYIVFVNRIGPHNYTIVGEPVPQTKKNAKAVNDVLCRSCVRQIGVWGLKNKTVFVGEQLRLVCRIKGTPLPALQWYKDGAPIIVTSRLRIQYRKRRSLLIIPEVRNSDSGRYECRGLGVQSINSVSSSSVVSITAKLDNITALWPLAGKPCPLHAAYCLNGGICTYYETIGEFTCQCADGFNGGRCENKDVVNSNSTYEPITCYDGVTPSYPCVTVHKPLDYSL